MYFLKALILLILRGKNDNNIQGDLPNKTFSVNIIVPMFNEEKIILNTLSHLLKIQYPNFKIIIIDDGSTDNSLSIVKKKYSQFSNIIIVRQKNQGKCFALNNGIAHSDSDIVVCIDADTLVRPDVLKKLLPYFNDERVAAVSGGVRVGNNHNLITKTQSIEYITNQNYERLMFQQLNGIIVVPGAIGAFRTRVIKEVGGYTSDTLTEDTDISMRILCNNYYIKNASEAYGFTEAPQTVRMFLRQRIRWKAGTIQVLIKYFREIFYQKNNSLKLIVIPYTWLFDILLPIFTPILDYLLLYNIFEQDIQFLLSYFLFVVIDSSICSVILLDRGGAARDLFFIPFQRLLLRQLIFMTHFHIILRFFKGNLNEWSKIIRYDSVRLD